MKNKEQIHQQCMTWASSGLQLGHKIVCITFIHRLENISPSFLLKNKSLSQRLLFPLDTALYFPSFKKRLLTLCNLST